MFERFTDRARRVLVLAQEEARLLHHNYIGTEHLLLGLVQEHDGVAARAINQLGISLDDVRNAVLEMVGTSATAPAGSAAPFSPRAKRVLELSLREALQLGHNYIGTEHILLGLVREGEGVAAQVFASLDVDVAQVRAQVVGLLSGYRRAGLASTDPADATGDQRQGGLVECSFCGRRPPDTGRIVAGRGGAYVCEHCLSDLKAKVATESGPSPEATSPPVITGRTPRHEEDARTEITWAFVHALVLSEDRLTVPNVEGGERLGPCLKEAQVRYAALRHNAGSVTVAAIAFIDETQAAVTFSMTLEGVASAPRQGRALMVGSNWKVARSTFCDVMRSAGVECPAL